MPRNVSYEVVWIGGNVAVTVTARNATSAARKASRLIARQYRMGLPLAPASDLAGRWVGLHARNGELCAVIREARA